MRKNLLLLALACSQLQMAQAKTPEQAVPLETVLRSIQQQNAVAFKSAYCKRIVQEEKAKGSDWSKLLQEGGKNMGKLLGDYRLNQFDYSYQGSPQSGNVTCLFQGKEVFRMRVIHEKVGWKLDER